MAVKSVIDIQVNDEAFSTFKALFDKYREQAGELPGVWAEVGKETKVASLSFADMVAAMMAQATLAETLEKRQRAAATASEKGGRAWKSLARDTKEAAKNILSATTALLKWSGITGIVSGLIGAGGLYGLDELALGVGAGRRSALGLGLGYGESKAFETDFGRFVDPNSFLSGITESLHDVRKKWMLTVAGASPDAVASGDAGAVGASLLESVKKLVDRTPANQLQQLSDSRGLGQFFSLQDLVRLRATPAAELADQERAYRTDSRSFGLTDETQRKWADFATQLTRAGNTIKTVLIDGLTPLTPSIAHLSDSFAKAVGTFLGVGDPVRMKTISDGIERFATYVGSNEFQKDVKDFASDVGTLADAIASALHALGKHSFQDTLFGAASGAAMGAVSGAFGGPVGIVGGAVVGGFTGYTVGRARDGLPSNGHGGLGNPTTGDNDRPARWYDPGSWSSKQGGFLAFPGGSAQRGFVSGTEKHYGLPTGLLTGVWGRESDFGRDPNSFKENSEHALGPFQFKPGTAKDYGVTDRTNFAQSSDGAARYLKDLLAHYHGEVAKALAAYNWGQGHVDKDVARHGADWQSHLPAETAKYVARVLSIAKKGAPGARITIENNTGGSAVVAASQLR